MKPTAMIPLLLLLYHTPAIAECRYIEQARLLLKNYGLVNCIATQFSAPSAMSVDLGATSRAYHFMGRGKHMIRQNEETLETLHDPYQATKAFVTSAYASTYNVSKQTNQAMVFYSCLDIFHSTAYDQFITSQDKYISPP